MPVLGEASAAQVSSPNSVVGAATPNYVAPASPVVPTNAWTNIEFVKARDFTNFGSCALGPGESSQWLRTTTYGFAIPDNATITSVSVRLGMFVYANVGDVDQLTKFAGIKLIVNNAIQGDDLRSGSPGAADGIAPPTIDVFGLSAGAATGDPFTHIVVTDDDFGLALTPTDINRADFGCAVGFYYSGAGNSKGVTIDYIELEVAYTLPGEVESLVAFNASVSGPAEAVFFRAAVASFKEKDVTFKASVSFGIELITPTEDPACPVITTAAMVVAWSITAVGQNGFRVRIYDDNTGAGSILYDSGFVGSSASTHTIPRGILPSPASNLYLILTITDGNGVTAQTDFVCFDTLFPTSVNVAGVALKRWGEGCDDPTTLPGIRISWNQVTPGAGETFLEYDIRRRRAGSTAWESIATIGTISTVAYVDHNVLSGQRYQYSVVWRAEGATPAEILQSADTSPAPEELSTFEFNWLHTGSLQTNDADFAGVRIESWTARKTSRQEVKYVQPWGRALPHVYIGQALGLDISVPLLEHPLEESAQWNALRELQRLQRDEGVLLCLRFGRAREMFFVTMGGLGRNDSQVQQAANLEFRETNFEGPI